MSGSFHGTSLDWIVVGYQELAGILSLSKPRIFDLVKLGMPKHRTERHAFSLGEAIDWYTSRIHSWKASDIERVASIPERVAEYFRKVKAEAEAEDRRWQIGGGHQPDTSNFSGKNDDRRFCLDENDAADD
jgi:hypothetical protein